MGTKAYFMINLNPKLCENGHYIGAIKELNEMPEVKSVEALSGIYDLIVEVDAPIRVILVANKILDKEWVKRLHILNEKT